MIEHAYIHIPFCIRKCNYCSFVSGFDISYKDEYIKSLIFEIKNKYRGDKLKTLYIGGGTPSLLEPFDINKILSCFNYDERPEITLEVNPETVDKSKFNEIYKIGINRISLGIQTFNNDILKIIGRKHGKKDILSSYEVIKDTGFSNISIDLIYGLPNQTSDDFVSDINQALKLKPQHISSYGLKIEEGSYFCNNLPENLPDEDMQAQMYIKLYQILKNNGYEHYEISNFALKGFQSRHNLSYWLNKNYYGFGLNASGYEGNIRYKNTSNFNDYIKNPLLSEEKNILTEKETMENEIFLALRLSQGVNIKNIEKKYGILFKEKYKNIIEKYTKLNLMKAEKNSISLTEQGFLLSNEIMSDFME